MASDRQGNSLTGASARAAERFDEAVDCFNFFRGDPVGLFDSAIAESPDFAMARIAKAWLFALATEPAASAMASEMADDAGRLAMDERERSHLAALRLLLAGEWTASADALGLHAARWPRDIVAIQSGHLLDFFRADAREMRDRIARVLPFWPEGLPGRSALLGMYAFGLEEAGDYARAEETGRQAIDLDPRDSWAHHAVAHVMEMQGRAGEGIAWMEARQSFWAGEGSYFKVHNWWHKALCHIDLMQFDAALALHDGPVREGEPGLAVSLADASALLWRLQLAGCDAGDRWVPLSEAWEAHADGKLYAFNDFHAVMAWLGAGRHDLVDRLIREYRETRPRNEAGEWGRNIGLPLAEGFAAFSRGDFELCATRLFGARQIANAFGGSHAQRDVIDLTLLEAAIRGRLPGLGEALASERLAVKPHSPVNRDFLARAQASAA